MEFDTNVKFRKLEEFAVTSDKSEEDFLNEIWTICSKRSSETAALGGGEFWMDYSSTMKTKYISCQVSEIPQNEGQENHLYNIVIKGGAKASRSGDFVMVFLALSAFWCLSKMLVPDTPILYYIGLIAAVALIIGLAIFSGKAFGREEAGNIMYEIQNRK